MSAGCRRLPVFTFGPRGPTAAANARATDPVGYDTDSRALRMNILGVTHPLSLNSAACILVDGQLIAFAEEERFIRLKHAPHIYPARAVAFCLEHAGLSQEAIDVTAVGFAAPTLEHARYARADAYVAGTLPDDDWFSYSSSLSWLHGDAQLRTYGRRWYADHHLSHAASAAIPSGFPRTNVITLDAWGGQSSGILGVFDRDTGIQVLREVEVLRSWGMTYELVTEYLGFRTHSAEGKTMGLASYGEVDTTLLPDWCEPELGLPDVKRYEAHLRTHGHGVVRRDPLAERQRNLAATLQHYYERSLLRIADWLLQRTGCGRFALAGGVALNCSGNGRLACHVGIDQVFIQPASHDGGTALGAAILAHKHFVGTWPEVPMPHAHWGPGYSSVTIKAALDSAGVPYQPCEPSTAAAEALARNEIVGWYQGRTEIGPRALGGRSILAHPGVASNLDRVNRIKAREPWRPLAPSVLAEHHHDVFELPHPSPFMLLAGRIRPHWRDRLPAVIHVDGSARPQSVSATASPTFHGLISRFAELTGLPVVLNTSFNHNDEPLVDSPEQAIATFYRTGLDTLVIGDYRISKR